jgi:hypothetical protein
VIVHSSGEMLGHIEENVNSAVLHTGEGAKELGKAVDLQKKSRKVPPSPPFPLSLFHSFPQTPLPLNRYLFYFFKQKMYIILFILVIIIIIALFSTLVGIFH